MYRYYNLKVIKKYTVSFPQPPALYYIIEPGFAQLLADLCLYLYETKLIIKGLIEDRQNSP